MRLKSLLLIVLFTSVPLWAGWNEEERKINFLLDEIAKVDGVFIRNDIEYSPDQSVAHLKMKMENAMNSWLAPDKEKWTAEMFIKKIASTSSISGTPYKIKFKNGQTVNAGDWLYERLGAYGKTP